MIKLSEGIHPPQVLTSADTIQGEGYIENSGSPRLEGTVIEQNTPVGGSAIYMPKDENRNYQRGGGISDLAIECRDENDPAIVINNVQDVLIERVLINQRKKCLTGIQFIEGSGGRIRNIKIKSVPANGVGIDWVDSTGGKMLVEDAAIFGEPGKTAMRVRHNGLTVLRGEMQGLHLQAASGTGGGGYFYCEGTRFECDGAENDYGCLIESEHRNWRGAVFNFPQISMRNSGTAFKVTNAENCVWHIVKGAKIDDSLYFDFGVDSKDNAVYTHGFSMIEGQDYVDSGQGNKFISV